MDRKGVTIYRGEYIHESAEIGLGTRIGAGHDIGKDVYDEKRREYESYKLA